MGNSQLIEFIISGDSMSPLLAEGQKILVDESKVIEEGDIVVTKHPIQTDLVIVKKVLEILPNNSLRLVGLNQKRSSHKFGLVKSTFVIGKVVMNLDEKTENL